MIIENVMQINLILNPKNPENNIFAAGCCDFTEDNGWDAWMREGD